MAVDIVPQLIDDINTYINNRFEKDERIKGLKARLNEGKSTFAEAHTYANVVGDIVRDAFGENIKSEMLPDGTMYFNIADRVIRTVLTEDYENITEFAVGVQELENQRRNIGLKALQPAIDNDRIEGIINRVSSEPYDNISWILDEPVVNFSQSIVDNVVRTNCEVQKNAGLKPKIIRRAINKCCDWCAKLEGTYIYGTEPHDVYRRHENCNCIVELEKGNFRQNAHTKQTYQIEHQEEIKERISKIEGIDNFKPATSIPEAEEFAKQFVDTDKWMSDGVSLKGISLENANELNKTLSTFYNNFDAELFAGISAPAKNSKQGKALGDAIAGRNRITDNLYLNKDKFKTAKTIQQALDENNAIAREYIKDPAAYLKKYRVSDRVLNVLNNCKESGRATYPASLKDAVNHELGHKMQAKVMEHPMWKEVENNITIYAPKVSGYATESNHEYIAESFSAYMNNDDIIDPALKKIFESFRR